MFNETRFNLPTSPDGFGVPTVSAALRNIDFSGLDYDTAMRAIIEYIKSYYPNDFNDFMKSNGVMMLVDIVAAVVAKLSLRADLLANESTLPTALTEEAVANHLALINQKIKRQTPATVDVECSVDQPITSDIRILAGTQFNFVGPDNKQTFYQIFRAPNDYVSPIVMPAGKKGVIAWGLEGRDASPFKVTSVGTANQKFSIQAQNILESPIRIVASYGDTNENWTPIYDPIERYGPNDKVVEVNFFDDIVTFRFGDGITGAIPQSGAEITFYCREGGGIRGRIGIGMIDTVRQLIPAPPVNTPTTVKFRNITPSNGGTDKETLAQAKRRAPREFAMQKSIVTADDYAQASQSFRHPAYGAISKAVATIRTSTKENLVEIYALAEGPENRPALPNIGLKQGLETYIKSLNVFTDDISVLPGSMKSVDIDMSVVVSRSADASVVKEKVESAIDKFFDLANWEMGQPLYVSNLIEAIEVIDGVSYVDLYSPSQNIIPTGKLAEPGSNGVGINELIVLGERKANYYYEKSAVIGGTR